jgi:hypothetical protein
MPGTTSQSRHGFDSPVVAFHVPVVSSSDKNFCRTYSDLPAPIRTIPISSGKRRHHFQS